MNIIRKLTLANLKKNRNRTIVTILGILLSTALILAVIGMAQSGQASLAAWQKQYSGDFHAIYTEVPTDAVPYITENAHVKSSSVLYSYGYAVLEGSLNEYMPYVFVMGGDDAAFRKLSLHLNEGRFPENENEIVVPETIHANAGMDLKLGDTLTLAIGRRVDSENNELFQHHYYDLDHPDTIVDTTTRTFTIVGITQRCSSLVEPYEAPGYTVFTYADSAAGAQYANVAATYTKASSHGAYTLGIMQNINEAFPENRINCSSNRDVLEYEGALSSRTLQALYTVAAIILTIIVLTSVFVIRNSFAISVSEKTRQYGMLASVGATARQIRSSVLFEGLIIGLIGIPLGVALGYGAIAVLIRILNLLLGDMLDGMRFHGVFSLPVLGLTVALGALTIYLSCLIPAIRAGRIAPIEAIRSNQDVRIRAGRLRVSGLVRKVFGIGGVIAAKNLKRSRRKYRTTVISLVV
ncbi:MAG: ABC transporter permease, partial [Clostridiales bacterium]|nr:ABC transporter permease [Clostridiales bacterium]